MFMRRNLVKLFRFINNLLDELIDRLMYIKELKEWESQKQKEGFPKEWFEKAEDD